MFCNNPQEIFSENEGCCFQIFNPKHQALKEILLSATHRERERERERDLANKLLNGNKRFSFPRQRERERFGEQTAEWQQASSAAIVQTISVRGTQDPSEETYSESVCEEGSGFRV
jgi:hypothetical protein